MVFDEHTFHKTLLRLGSVAGFAEPALPLIGHTQTQPHVHPKLLKVVRWMVRWIY